jgi:malonate transporter
MTLILLNALLPILVGLLLGCVAGRRGVMDNLNVRNLIVLVMDFAIPCALSSTINSTSWPVLREQSGAITISPLTIALLASDKLSDGKGVSIQAIAITFLRAFTRPVVWAPMLALVSVYFGLHLPSYLDRSLTIPGSAASGSALILTRVVVSSQTFRFAGKVARTTAAIVLIQPLFALGIMELLHMSHDAIRDITLISAIPGGFFGLVFGKSFNATPETASSGLIASYAVGAFSLAG